MKSKVSGSQLSRRRFLRAAGGTVLLGSVPLLTRYASAAEEIRLGGTSLHYWLPASDRDSDGRGRD